MSLYLDTSALLKRYVDEIDSGQVERWMLGDSAWLTARHTWVEVRRNLGRLLEGDSLATARSYFECDWSRTHVVELDETTCRLAADIAEVTGTRTLDALHLAALRRVGDAGLRLLTFDLRQAQTARTLGIAVVGA